MRLHQILSLVCLNPAKKINPELKKNTERYEYITTLTNLLDREEVAEIVIH